MHATGHIGPTASSNGPYGAQLLTLHSMIGGPPQRTVRVRYWIRVDCARSERHRSKQRRAPAKSDWNERSEFILNSRPSPTGSARWWTRVCRFLAPCSRSSGSATPPSKCAAGGLGTKCGRVCGTRIYKKPRPGVGLMRLSTRPNSTRGGRKYFLNFGLVQLLNFNFASIGRLLFAASF